MSKPLLTRVELSIESCTKIVKPTLEFCGNLCHVLPVRCVDFDLGEIPPLVDHHQTRNIHVVMRPVFAEADSPIQLWDASETFGSSLRYDVRKMNLFTAAPPHM